MNREKFDDIFREAQVIDVDFSLWDQHCSFLILANEETAFGYKRLPAYCVDFLEARRVDVVVEKSRPLAEGHFQWIVYKKSVREVGDLLEVQLSGFDTCPVTTIVCSDIRIEYIEIEIIDRLFPGWDHPTSPFARPGIREMARRARLAVKGPIWT